MSGTSRRGPLGGFPLGLIGAFALVVLVERTIARHDLDFTELGAVNWSYSKRAARTVAPKTEILCFGTSLMKFGVLPRSIEAATGRSAYNLATCNGHMPTTYYLFKRALDAGARPAAVLVDCQDRAIRAEDRDKQAEALRVNLRNWPELLSVSECLDLSWQSRDATFFASTLLAEAVPSYKSRYEIRNVVTTAFEGRDGSSRHNSVLFLRNWNANLGTNVMPASVTHKENEVAVPPSPEAAVSDPFAQGCLPRNHLTDLYTRRFLELAAANHVPVFWLIPPVPAPVMVVRETEGDDRYFSDLARSAQGIYPDVTVIDGSHSGYAPDTFCDMVHMNAKGAVAFSDAVASVVARSLSGRLPRTAWVEIPRYEASRSRPPASLEDVEASGIALKEGRIRFRR